MTLLTVMPENSAAIELRTTDPEIIRNHLAGLGVEFERREVRPAPDDLDQNLVLDRHRALVDDLCAQRGFRLTDVAAIAPSDDEEWPARAAAARATFREEHSHAEDEVRLFVSGTGCFYLHIDGRVHAVVCTSGDLISVPAGTRHWFDMGERPEFCAIRFFTEEDGWVGRFEPDSIAARFPTLNELVHTDGGVSSVVLDIEGTCSPLAAVREQLFGYACAHYLAWVTNPTDAAHEVLELAQAEAAQRGVDTSTPSALAAVLTDWTEKDLKSPALKRIQGQIWQAGFARGELIAPVYPDVVRALQRWQAARVAVHIYSSGSATAQRAWFGHTDQGDLTPYLAGYFDLDSAGPKREPASYRRIAAALATEPADLLFLTDVAAEAQAAEQAGWHARVVHRPGNSWADVAAERVWLTTFDDLDASLR